MPDDPRNCLSAWTALEVLSPPTFRNAADLAVVYNGELLLLDLPLLPWEQSLPALPKNLDYYYHIVLGTVSYEATIHALLEKYGDKSPEWPSLSGEVILGSLLLDAQGKLLTQQGVAIASFGWGFPVALEKSLRQLSDWVDVEQHLTEQLASQLVRTDEAGIQVPINLASLRRARTYLLQQLKIPSTFVTPNWFALRCKIRRGSTPDPLLLNSFFLGDLALARQLFAEGKAPVNLQRYLGVIKPKVRQNLLEDSPALENLLSPARFSPGRWPGPGRHSLVLLQQAAVNAAFQTTPEQSILAVNGPPGTGKTTLLRDVVAGVVTQRAEALCTFDSPKDAFEDSREKLSFGGSSYVRLYRLDQRVKGYELLIASSNNKAVENVSTELPGIGAITDDADDLRYFAALSNALLGRESWGLIAAVLGNASNKYKFSQTFWWDTDIGFSTYLAEAAGTPQWVDEKDPITGQVIGKRKPKIITDERPPQSQEEAIDRWQAAKTHFQQALKDSRGQLASLESVRELLQQQLVLERAVVTCQAILTAKQGDYSAAKWALDEAESVLATLTTTSKKAQQERLSHGSTRPGFWARLFRRAKAKTWMMERRTLNDRVADAHNLQSGQERIVQGSRRDLAYAESAIEKAREQLSADQANLQKLEHLMTVKRAAFPGTWLDRSFFRQGHEARHLSIPWCDAAIHHLRDAVFISALQVHRAFIDASAKQFKHNLSALLYTFSKGALPDDGKMSLLPDLWSSLFLIIPAISTTFASVERLLGRLPPASLGWLLVDEAGQALPQAAIGALLRTQRAVVVGDPLQIEPVVVLPELLTYAICQHFDIDPIRFNAPKASVQTLADAATAYYAEFESLQSSRAVGVPLLVHRRCAEPMFSISNTIAYSRQMVSATPRRGSTIRDCLGPSSWIDVQGTAEEKWCPQEGQAVLALLGRLKTMNVAPNLYIITPFAIVSDRLREMVRQSHLLEGWVGQHDVWPYERIGTVHTVQGREAEAVFFVLGAPADNQGPSRDWAGRTPNILNVAVTRAKDVLYVVGNRRLWQPAGLFQQLSNRME